MNTHAIIQARMGASRLPGKVLLPFMSTTFLEYVTDRVRQSPLIEKVIIASTENPLDDAIVDVCEKRGYAHFRGSENDPLNRYATAAAHFRSDIIVRVTADNPFTDIDEMERLVRHRDEHQLDYVGNHQKGMPPGLGTEVFTLTAITKADQEAKEPFEREHVTPYFYRNPELFRQEQLVPLYVSPEKGIRLALDTDADYKLLKEVETAFAEKKPTPIEVIHFLEAHPEIRALNQEVEQVTVPLTK